MAKSYQPKAASLKNLKPAKKGEVRNPEGGRSHNPAIKALKNLTLETYREVLEIVMTGKVDDLRKMVEHPDTTALQVGVATAFMRAIKEGDYNIIEQIASRIIGKLPDEINIKSQNANLNADATKALDMTKLKAAWTKLQNDV